MKVIKKRKRIKPMDYVESAIYSNYVAIDWSVNTISIATMHNNSSQPKVTNNLPATLKVIKEYLEKLKGKIILTIEETTGSQWLYVELKDFVEKIVICNPYRNSLLKEGPKNDPKDAADLCRLLRSGLVKEVYHSNDANYRIRKLVSSYIDLVKAGVRVKNQLSAIYRGFGLNYKKDKIERLDKYTEFIKSEKERSIAQYLREKKEYIKIFNELKRTNPIIKSLTGISGIDAIGAVKIFSVVIDAERFPDKYKYWSYCGLVKYKMESGGKVYGKRNTNYNRVLKEVYKIATSTSLRGKSDIREYYEFLLKNSYAPKEARNKIGRYIAKSTLAMMKNRTKYKPYSWRTKEESRQSN